MTQSHQKKYDLKSAGHGFNTWVLYTIMAYPENLDKRKRLFNALKLQRYKVQSTEGRAKILEKDLMVLPLLLNSIDEFWEPSLREVLKKGNQNYEKAIIAGNILLNTLSLGIHHKGYSYTKAKFLVKEMISEKKLSIGKFPAAKDRTLDSYWKEYRSIAHFSAAVSLYANKMVSDLISDHLGKPKDTNTEFSLEDCDEFLSHANYPISLINHLGYFNEKIIDEVAQCAEVIHNHAITASPRVDLKNYLDPKESWQVVPSKRRLSNVDIKTIIGPLLPETLNIVKKHKTKKKKIKKTIR